MALYLKKLAVLNQGTDAVAQLVNVMEGAEGSAVFGYNVEDASLGVANGQKLQFKQTHTLSLSVLPPAGANATVMDAILASESPVSVRVSGMSDDTFLLWDNAGYLMQNDEYGDTITRHLTMTEVATIGYRGVAPATKLPVYSGVNALAIYNLNAGSTTALNGFTVAGGATGVTSSGGTQVVTVGATVVANTVYFESNNIFFPFEGESLTVSMFVNVAFTPGSFAMGIQFLSDPTTVISTSSVGFSSGATGTRIFHTATIPATTKYIRMSVLSLSGILTGSAFTITTPMIALTPRTTYGV